MSTSVAAGLPAGAPRAGGRVIREASADQAAQWLTLFMSGEASAEQHADWQRWRAEHPDNELAWQHIEAVRTRFGGLHGTAASRSIASLDAPRQGRRKYLSVMIGAGLAGVVGVAGMSAPSVGRQLADMRTGIGERREWTLADGTRVLLNTGSAINIQFDARQRLLRLLEGEIRIVTGHDPAYADKPFVVQTAEGSLRALGTDFLVRQHAGRTELTVQQSAVEIVPARVPRAARVVQAGERTWFSPDRVAAPVGIPEDAVAWLAGRLVADEVRLADFLQELGRYRHGVLRCAPAVADLRFSGVFPLDDTERILAMLPRVLPVRLHARTRFWITVDAA